MNIFVQNEEGEIFSHIFNFEDDFGKLLDTLDGNGILQDSEGNILFREDKIKETALIDQDTILHLDSLKVDGKFLSEKSLYLNVYTDYKQTFNDIPPDVNVEQILTSIKITGGTEFRVFPKEFLPVYKRNVLPKFNLSRNFDTDSFSVVLNPKKLTFNHDDEVEKTSRFNFDVREEFNLRNDENIVTFIDKNLQETKSVISGSWILNELLTRKYSSDYRLEMRINFCPGDIDIFSESLDLLIMILETFNITISMDHAFNSSFTSYKFDVCKNNRGSITINYIHVNCDGQLTNRLNESSTERVLKFIKRRFDLSCCIVSYDGEFIHYNSSVLREEMDICGKITDKHVIKRIKKYKERGFKVCEIKHTETSFFLYGDEKIKQKSTQVQKIKVLYDAIYNLRDIGILEKIYNLLFEDGLNDKDKIILLKDISIFKNIVYLGRIFSLLQAPQNIEFYDIILSICSVYDKYEIFNFIFEWVGVSEETLSRYVRYFAFSQKRMAKLESFFQATESHFRRFKCLKIMEELILYSKHEAFRIVNRYVHLEEEDYKMLFDECKKCGNIVIAVHIRSVSSFKTASEIRKEI